MGIKERLQKARRQLAAKEIDGLLVSQPENRYYLSGFNGSYGHLLITAQQAVLATDFRYVAQAKVQAPEYRIFQVKNGNRWLPELMASSGVKELGFESEFITYAAYRQMSETLRQGGATLKLVPLEGLVESLRVIKEPDEIELIKQAISITEKAYEYAAGFLQPGMTELEAVWKIESFMRESGSESVPFELIVASGPNAALPHARPSERRLAAGEPVVVDIGARVAGYASDMTRTFRPGKPDEQFRKVYDTVLGAHLSAIALIKEGMTGEAADSLARTVIAEAGYGDAFGHSLGHGVGLAVHEAPRLGINSKDILSPGMVFTIEPGIYLPGWGGVRIEDMAVIEGGKASIITHTRKVY